jgi:hypothetical protein
MVMKRRWRLLLMLVLLLLVAGSFLLPAVHWRVIGWVKGEAFYEGRPTSYWSGEAKRWEWKRAWGTGTLQPAEGWDRRSSPSEEFLEAVTGNRSWFVSAKLVLVEPEPAALSVLIELLHDPSPQVRLIAVRGLGYLSQEAKPAIPALQALCGDEHVDVRQEAITTVRWIELGPQGPP